MMQNDDLEAIQQSVAFQDATRALLARLRKKEELVRAGEALQRKTLAQEARDALSYANDIIATLREPFLVLDSTLRVKTASPAFYRTFQVARADTEGRLLYDLGTGQWGTPLLRTLLEKVLPEDHSFQDLELEHEFPSIGRKVMRLNARRVVSAAQGPPLILLAIEDVTERRRAETSVRTSDHRYRRLFETAKDGILILDADTGKILDANPFMSELLGHSHAEFLGKQLWQIGLFSDKAENEAAFRELQEHGYARYDHLPLMTERGNRTEVEFVSNVYRVDDRHVAQCNIRDISDRSRLDKQTKEHAAELSDLHRRKDEFLAMLSHELRNPLAPIMNAVELLRLQEESENPIQQQARMTIARQVGHLKHLVDDLLEISRITTGRVQLRQDRVAIRDVVEGAVEAARPMIDQRRHELTVSMPDEPIWLHADAARLEQVAVNLLNNAAKYTEEGGRIWLTIEPEGSECVLRVRDTGIGIAPELLPRIFDLFTQADRMLERSQGGLGIGLCLVQRLVELHAGTVEVTSTPGEGSEFIVRLPRVLLSVLAAPSPVAEASRHARGLRVLVVDDNVDMAETLGMLVKAAGHDVRMAHDGPAALQAAADYRPNAVLLDIGLPGMHGYEVAKRLRQQAGPDKVLLVAVTGYGQESDLRRSRDEGFDHHMVKPPDFRRLRAVLESVSE